MSDLKIAVVISIALGLAGCGGGGGSEAPANTTPANRAPTANAGADQSVDELSVVTLDGTRSSDLDNNPLTYAWSQTGGASVTLSSTTASQPTFDAPDVTALDVTETLTFQLTVSDGKSSGTDTVSIVVNDVGLGINTAPISDAGLDKAVLRLLTVTLDGSASSDPDGTILTYLWTQISGTSVALSDASVSQPTFMAPDAVLETLIFELSVSDGVDSVADTVTITVVDKFPPVTVAGKVELEFVLPNANCRGLNFNNIDIRPMRAVTVQLIDDAGAILGTTVSGNDGAYSFAGVDGYTEVRIRVRAELKRTGSPNWDVEVRDNTSEIGLNLDRRPLYVIEFAGFNTGGADTTDADFVATTGWDTLTNSYTGTRAAAPFAVLDAIYDGMLLVLSADTNASFAPLDAFWSINNTLTSPSDIDAGELSSSFYRSDLDSLFLLGDANTDTEEFDDHVSVHEWGHYFEDNFSRSDSIGGAHSLGQSIDPRLAFGEGWATALAAMALNEPQYCDTGVVGTSSGFGINTETDNSGSQGYFNEMSVATLIYDLFDTNPDGADNGSIGFGPIFNVMTGPQRTTEAFTTLFSFATALRAEVDGADLALLDALLAAENVNLPNVTIYADNQTTFPSGARDVDPVYTTIVPDGSVTKICTNSDFDSGRDGNKLSEHRFLKVTTTSSGTYTIRAEANPIPPAEPDPDDLSDRSDPDIFVWRNGTFVTQFISGADDVEVGITPNLLADTYVIALQEFRYSDEDTPSDFPEQICFDFSMTP